MWLPWVAQIVCNVGDPGLIPELGNPLEKMATHFPSILAQRIPMDPGALTGYSPWGRRESQTGLTYAAACTVSSRGWAGDPADPKPLPPQASVCSPAWGWQLPAWVPPPSAGHAAPGGIRCPGSPAAAPEPLPAAQPGLAQPPEAAGSGLLLWAAVLLETVELGLQLQEGGEVREEKPRMPFRGTKQPPRTMLGHRLQAPGDPA